MQINNLLFSRKTLGLLKTRVKGVFICSHPGVQPVREPDPGGDLFRLRRASSRVIPNRLISRVAFAAGMSSWGSSQKCRWQANSFQIPCGAGQQQIYSRFSPSWRPNETAALHCRVPAAYSSASISNELEIASPEEKDRCACRSAATACTRPASLSASKQTMREPARRETSRNTPSRAGRSCTITSAYRIVQGSSDSIMPHPKCCRVDWPRAGASPVGGVSSTADLLFGCSCSRT